MKELIIMKERNIYNLMNEVSTLRFNIICAYSFYKQGKKHYYTAEQNAIASLSTLLDVDYITSYSEYKELFEQLNHIFEMYKKHC